MSKQQVIDWPMEMDRRNRELARMTGHRDELKERNAKLVAALTAAKRFLEEDYEAGAREVIDGALQQSTEKPW